MNKAIKKIIKGTFLYNIYRYFQLKKELQNWHKKGKSISLPSLMKQKIVKEYAKKFNISTFIETGTYMGDMVNATKKIFKKIYSIELDNKLSEEAKNRFSRFANIEIIHGDSKDILPRILSNITEPCLFWLDAHYSGGITARGKKETPIMEELNCILSHPLKETFVILIDDARLFIGLNDYPDIKEIKSIIYKKYPGWMLEIKDDIIRIHGK